MKKKPLPVTNIGTISLLMIFVVLFLVTFSTLSLSSAERDYKLSKNVATNNTAYYNASGKAAYKLRDIDHVFLSLEESCDSKNYKATLLTALDAIDDLDISQRDNMIFIRFTEEMTKHRLLEVVLRIEDGTDGAPYYTVAKWSTISTQEWVRDDTYNLM